MSYQGEKATLEEESLAYTGVNTPIFRTPPPRHAPKQQNQLNEFRHERECTYF